MRKDILLPFFFALALSTSFFLFSVDKSEGHANPIVYIPSPNATIEKTFHIPSNVTIFFSEKPEPKLGFIHVLNSDNERIDNSDYTIIGKNRHGSMVTLKNNMLLNGTYTVSWLTVSQDSGLITKGSYTFTIKIDGNTEPSQNVS